MRRIATVAISAATLFLAFGQAQAAPISAMDAKPAHAAAQTSAVVDQVTWKRHHKKHRHWRHHGPRSYGWFGHRKHRHWGHRHHRKHYGWRHHRRDRHYWK